MTDPANAPVQDSPQLLVYVPPLKLQSCCAKPGNAVRKATPEDVASWTAANGGCSRCKHLEGWVQELWEAAGMDNASSYEDFKKEHGI